MSEHPAEEPTFTEDRLLGGRIRLQQPVAGYRVAIDPVFLAAAVPAEPHQLVLDVGCGAGAAMLCLAARVPHSRLVGLEMQRDLVRLAGDNIILNGLEARASVMIGDLLHPPPRLSPGAFDHVMANPPFHRHGDAEPAAAFGKSMATVEGDAELADWVRFSLAMVRSKGTVTFIHRADRIDALLGQIAGRAGEVVVFPLWPGQGRAASRILVRARRQVAAPARLAAGLVLHDADGRTLGRCGGRAARGSRVRSLIQWLQHMQIPIWDRMNFRDQFNLERLWRRGPVVSVLRFEGVIMPRQRRGGLSLASHAGAIEKAFRASGLVAVAIVVNSPGGSPVQSALLYRQIRQLADEKHVPVIAFAEDVAASGGYWLALAGDEIFTEETSLIGSIGVISAGFGFYQLLGRLGIERRLHTAGERKSLLDPFLPEDPSDVARLTELQRDIHQSFKEHVRRRRAGKIDEADETLFTGDVLTGRMAIDRGLVDGIGELRTVMRTRYGDKVRLRPISAERRRLPFLSRLPFVGREPVSLVAELADWLETRLLWARFGL